MKNIVFAVACLIVIASAPLLAQTNKADLSGVWQGTLDGMPGVTLTLAEDSGQLGGTVVFYAIGSNPPRILSIEPHIVLHAKVEGNTLSFQVKLARRDLTGPVTIKVVFGAENKAQLQCLDCGAGSPTAELIKQTE